MERWQNKVSVITGASSGIGAACCKALLEKGMVVVGLARRFERMENEFKKNLPKELQNRFYAKKCDVSKEEDILEAFKWIEQTFGGVDVLINNAGIGRETQLTAENNTADLKDILDVNVLGVALCTREAFRSMKKRNFDGHIVIINSIAGHKVPNIPGVTTFNIYPSSKYALTAMTEMLRQEFLGHQTKIKITSVSPGATDTEMLISENFKDIAAENNMIFLKSEDVADAVVYCIQTPPHVQIHELIIKPIGEKYS